jgi:hypothetical protein
LARNHPGSVAARAKSNSDKQKVTKKFADKQKVANKFARPSLNFASVSFGKTPDLAPCQGRRFN